MGAVAKPPEVAEIERMPTFGRAAPSHGLFPAPWLPWHASSPPTPPAASESPPAASESALVGRTT